MLAKAANSRDDLSCHPNPLQEAIESTLHAARLYDDQMERVRELGVKAAENKEAKQKPEIALFKINSKVPPDLLKESSPRGDYLRALFHLLYMPICVPHSQVIAPAGIGKTRECAQGLELFAGCTIYYFVPTHDLARQLANTLQKAGFSAVHPVYGG